MPQHAMIGREVGNYVLRSLLGEGGMGAVFLAEHRFLGTKAAVKLLHGSYAHNREVAQRFFQEARASVEIRHPGVVQILDFGLNPDGSLYLVMELLEGRSLAETIEQRPFGEAATARIGAAIADALAAAHAKGIIHRDLKPDNVFLVGDAVKVLDFGIAKVLSSSSGTQSGTLFGTPQYMAPEQAKGSKHVTPLTDVYALGAILFEMLTGRPVFLGEDAAELITKQLFEAPQRPSELARISVRMEALILACLEKEPERRPGGMGEVCARLRALAPLFSDDSTTVSPPPSRAAASPISSASTEEPVAYADTQAAPRRHAVSTISHAASEVATRTIPRSRRTIPPQFPRRRRWARIALAGAGSTAVAVTLVVVGLKARQPTSAPTSPPRPSAASSPTAPVSAPEQRTLRLHLDPADARVEIDGVEVKGSTIKLARSATPHRMVVSAPGRVTLERTLPVDAGGELEIALAVDAAPARQRSERVRPAPDRKPAGGARRNLGPVVDDL